MAKRARLTVLAIVLLILGLMALAVSFCTPPVTVEDRQPG